MSLHYKCIANYCKILILDVLTLFGFFTISKSDAFLPPASEGWGKVIFSVCSHLQGGGYPISGLRGVPHLRSGVPHLRSEGGYPISGQGVPHLRSEGGYPISGLRWGGGTLARSGGGTMARSRCWERYPISGRGYPGEV